MNTSTTPRCTTRWASRSSRGWKLEAGSWRPGTHVGSPASWLQSVNRQQRSAISSADQAVFCCHGGLFQPHDENVHPLPSVGARHSELGLPLRRHGGGCGGLACARLTGACLARTTHADLRVPVMNAPAGHPAPAQPRCPSSPPARRQHAPRCRCRARPRPPRCPRG